MKKSHERSIKDEATRRFLEGRGQRLEVPKTTLEEFAENDAEDLAHELYGKALGYRFPWGDILEQRRKELDEEAGQQRMIRAVSWDFIMDQLLGEYRSLGGNLEELSDMMLLAIDGDAKIQAALEKAPDIDLGDGLEASAFDMWTEQANEEAVRRWIAAVFLPKILPRACREASRCNLLCGPSDKILRLKKQRSGLERVSGSGD